MELIKTRFIHRFHSIQRTGGGVRGGNGEREGESRRKRDKTEMGNAGKAGEAEMRDTERGWAAGRWGRRWTSARG
eukprot:309543-Amorphochlora_amoeboformis.AAC.1